MKNESCLSVWIRLICKYLLIDFSANISFFPFSSALSATVDQTHALLVMFRTKCINFKAFTIHMILLRIWTVYVLLIYRYILDDLKVCIFSSERAKKTYTPKRHKKGFRKMNANRKWKKLGGGICIIRAWFVKFCPMMSFCARSRCARIKATLSN